MSPRKPEYDVLDRLLQFAFESEKFEAILNRRPEHITPQLADSAKDMWRQALAQREAGLAQRAILTAYRIFQRLGNQASVYGCELNYHETSFMAANTPDEYIDLRNQLRETARRAAAAGALDTAFGALTRAADCAFFAAEGDADDETKTDLLAKCGGDLAEAAIRAPEDAAHQASEYFSTFVSLLAAFCDLDVTRSALRTVDSQLFRQLAAAAERLIPPDFEVPGGSRPGTDMRRVRLVLAELSLDYGDAEAGARWLEHGLTVLEPRDREHQLRYQFDWYTLKRTAGRENLEPARRRILNWAEEYRTTMLSRAGRLWAAQELDHEAGEVVMDQLRENGDATLTFFAVESGKARVLLDQRAGLMSEVRDVEAAARARSLETEILHFEAHKHDDELGSEMRLVSYVPIGLPFGRERHEQLLGELETVYQEQGAGFRGTRRPAALPDVQTALAPDEALINYCLPYGRGETRAGARLWIVFVTRDAMRVVSTPVDDLGGTAPLMSISVDGQAPIDTSPLNEAVCLTRNAIRRGDEKLAAARLAQLRRVLVAPLEREGIRPSEFARWIIVPSRSLTAVPFAALPDEQGVPLGEQTATLMAPSASVWLDAATARCGPLSSFLAFANPALGLSSGLDPLPGAEDEVREISSLLDRFNCDVYSGPGATESRLVAKAKGRSILHFATHASFPEHDAIDLHRLVLAPGPKHDGEVRADEIRRLDLSDTQLVVLSVCNGGLYRFGPGAEPYGLTAAFLAAGTHNVLATLWPINDAAGRRMVVRFYRHLLGCGPAAALKNAAAEARRDGAPICEWAAFALAGAGRPLR